MSEVFTWNHIEATLRNVFSRDKKGQEIFICKKLYFLLAVYVKNKDKKVEVAFLMHLSPVFFLLESIIWMQQIFTMFGWNISYTTSPGCPTFFFNLTNL